MHNLNALSSIFLLASPAAPGTNPSPFPSLILMVGIILVFWVFMIRPQAKKAKQQKKFIDDLQKGDKIVTIAGIHGKIAKVNADNTLDLEISSGLVVVIEKSAISMEWSVSANKNVATV